MAKPAVAAVTFTHDVAPILYANCVSCHHTGEVAPFPLITFNDVHKRAGQIAAVTDSKFMPPWKPTPGFGHFEGERKLSDEQIKTLADWKAEGAPEGDPGDLPPVPEFNGGWQLGQPDLIVRMSKPFTLPADGNHGNDVYRAFVMPMNFTENKYVRAVEFHPGNKKIVHHALFFLDSSGVAARKQAASKDGQPGFGTFGGPGFIPTGGLGGWAPGHLPNPLPDGWGKLLRGGSDLVIQEHLHPDGKVETEQSELGIYFTKEKPERIVGGSAVRSMWINIPANDPAYIVTASLKVPADVDLIGVSPHAHLVCKEMWAEATLPDGTKQPLIWIKDWDFKLAGRVPLRKTTAPARRHGAEHEIHVRQQRQEHPQPKQPVATGALRRTDDR